MKRILFVLIFCIAITMQIVPTYGQMDTEQMRDVSLDPVEIMASMYENGTTMVRIDARVNNFGVDLLETVSLRIDSLDVELARYTVDNQSATGTTTALTRYTEISLPLPNAIQENESAMVHLEMKIEDAQSEPVLAQAGTHMLSDFIFYLRPLTTFSNITFTAKLPDGASLSQETVVPLFPEADANFTDGLSMSFLWYIDLIQPGQEKVFMIKYQLPNLQTTQTVLAVVGEIIAGFLGLLAGAILVYVGPKLWRRLRQVGAVRIVGITEEEETIVEVIRRKGGSCPQKDLYIGLDMSQSKVSMILSNLEERGVIRRIREGRVNTIQLVEGEMN